MVSARFLLPTSSWTRALFAPALIFVACGVDRNYQTDFWHHLARGRAIAERGALVDHDLFTFTVPGRAFQDTNWLTQLLYHALYEAGGLPLVQVVNGAALALMTALLVALCRRRSGSLMLAAAAASFAFVGLWQLLLIRPQTFSLLLFVLLYAALERAEGRRGWLLLAPPLLALWVNLHGAFPIGLVLVGCYLLSAAGEAWRAGGRGWWRDGKTRALGLCLAGCVAATLLNPYGGRVYQYVGLTSSVAAARRIDEWVAPGLHLLVSKVWVVSLLAMLVLFALPGRRPRVREVILVLCFLPAACGSVRMVAWWLLVSAPIAASLLAANLPARVLNDPDADRPTVGNAVACGLLVVAAVLSLPWLERCNPALVALGRARRVEADLQSTADVLRARRPAGRVFTRFEWGEYLGWALAPRGTVFMDGRIEIYPDEVWDDYTAVTRGRADWERLLVDVYDVDCLLLDTEGGYHADLLPLVESSPLWERTVTSGPAALFLRRAPGEARAGR